MKKEGLLLGIFWGFILGGAFAADSGGSDFKEEWLKAEQEYARDYKNEQAAEQRKMYIQLYFDLGREYYNKKDYPSALVCFRRVVDLEKEEGICHLTLVANKFLKEIDQRLSRQIEKECSIRYGKDLQRIKKGVDMIIAQVGRREEAIIYPDKAGEKEKVEEKKTPEEKDALTLEIEKLRRQLNKKKEDLDKERELMRLQIQKEVLAARQEIEKLIFAQKVKSIQIKREVTNKLLELKDLYRKHKYDDALEVVRDILELDPDNLEAKQIRDSIRIRLRHQEELKRKREELAKRRELLKKRREELIKKREEARRRKEEERRKLAEKRKREALERKVSSNLKRALSLMALENYEEASRKLGEVLKLDPANKEAVLLLEYIKGRIKEISERAKSL